ncbi:hypothetical protein F5Y16DRAFT_363621 [Xylariaceae sp. FL0255]|nr:hypothetical protein F5Y16DRAFT_363621 [Xylariaceae sp. FL0255]
MTKTNLRGHLSWLLANIDLSSPTAPVLPILRELPSAESSPSDDSKYFTPTSGLSPAARTVDISASTHVPLYPTLPVQPSTSFNGAQSHSTRPEENRRGGESVTENMGRLASRSTSKRPGLTLRQEQLLTPTSTTAPASIARDFSARLNKKTDSPRKHALESRPENALLTPGPTRPSVPSLDSVDLTDQDDQTSPSTFFGNDTRLWREDFASRAEPLPSSENSMAFGSDKVLWNEEQASRPAPLSTEEDSDIFGSDIMIWEEEAALRSEPILSTKRGKKRKSDHMSDPTTTTTPDEFPDILDLLGDDESVLYSHRKGSPPKSPARSKLKTSPAETPSRKALAAESRQKQKKSPGRTPTTHRESSSFKSPSKALNFNKPDFSPKKPASVRSDRDSVFGSDVDDMPKVQPKSQKSGRRMERVVQDSDDEPMTPSPVKEPRSTLPRSGKFSQRPVQSQQDDIAPAQSTPSKTLRPISSQATAQLRSPLKSERHQQSQNRLSQPIIIKKDESKEIDLSSPTRDIYNDVDLSAVLQLLLQRPSIIETKRSSLEDDLRHNRENFKRSLQEGSLAPRERLRRDKEQLTKQQLSLDILSNEFKSYEDLSTKRDALIARISDAYEHDLNTEDDEAHLQELDEEVKRRHQLLKECLANAGINNPRQFEGRTSSTAHIHRTQSFVQATQPGGPTSSRPKSRESGHLLVTGGTQIILQTQLTPGPDAGQSSLEPPFGHPVAHGETPHRSLATSTPRRAARAESIQAATARSAAVRPQSHPHDDLDDFDEEMFEIEEGLPYQRRVEPAIQVSSERKKGKTPRKEPLPQKQAYESDYSDDIDITELAEQVEFHQSSSENRRAEPSRPILSETSGNAAARKERPAAKRNHGPDVAVVSPQQKNFPWYKDVKRALKDRFRMSGFRHNQLEAINATLSGKDAFILMPTGGGKSLCYQLPAVVASGRTSGLTVVVSPLLSLMQDQVEHLTKLNIHAATFNGDTPASERKEILTRLKQPFPETFLQLLYVTPEMITKSQAFVNGLTSLYRNKKLARLVIDEAHCVSQWGHDFRPDYKELSSFREQFPDVPLMALTATATQNVIMDVKHNLGIDQCEEFSQSFNRPNLYYEIRKKEKDNTGTIAELINSTYPGKTGIVYTLSRKSAETIAQKLQEHGINAHHYHAGMKPADKTAVQRDWQKGKIKVVVATIAFGMGIDKPDVRFVIHQSVPKSLEGYYQETGRAGRDGKPSECYLYFNYGDVTSLRKMIADGDGSYEQKERQRNMLASVIAFCDNQSDCRRVEILRYFGESFSKAQCNATCDNCLSTDQFETKDFTKYALAVLEIVRSEGKATLAQCTDYLMGKKKKSDFSEGVEQFHGIAKGLAKHDIHRVIDRLAVEEALKEENLMNKRIKFPVQYFKIGRKANSFLANGRQLRLTTRVKNGESRAGPSNVQRRLKTPAAPATRPDTAGAFTSTYLSSPARRTSSKKKGKAVAVVDEDSDEDFNTYDNGYSRDGFIVDDDEEDSDNGVEVVPRRYQRPKGPVGPPILRDARMDAENLSEIQRDVLDSFFDEARVLEERVRTSKGLRQPIFTQLELREMGLRWTITLEQMREIPGINTDKVDRHGAKLLPLIQQYHQQYQEMMGHVSGTQVVDLVSSDDDDGDEDMVEFIDDDIDYDDLGEEASAYFNPPAAAPRSAWDELRDSSQPKLHTTRTSGGGSGSTAARGKRNSGGAPRGRKKSFTRKFSGSGYAGVKKKGGGAPKRGSSSRQFGGSFSSQQGTSRGGARGGSKKPAGVGFSGIPLMDH